ncbi:MAG: flagellar motor protein MotD [Azoarcus sp.]|jgi:chemotaxis protein MotB|nr:flagellar motor protein MotD [Azoarcus sp.]
MPRHRKFRGEEHENTERWLVSYADFITLLFAFFVVMYSLSSLNEGKYRALSDALGQAFRSADIAMENPQIVVPPGAMAPPPVRPRRAGAHNKQADERRRQTTQKMRNMADAIRGVLRPLTENGQVNVTEGAFGVTVEINASALFAPGEAVLGSEAVTALRAVAGVISTTEFPITVEGHTDNLPINNYRFPSNWELSAVRASAVVRLFVESGVFPDRLTAAGYADQRPVAGNDTETGRARNRRVAIMIESRLGALEPPPVSELQPASEPEADAPDDDAPDVDALGGDIRSILPSVFERIEIR